MQTTSDDGTGNVIKRSGRPTAPREVYCQSIAQLAWMFGVNDRTLARWVAAGAPTKGGNGYDTRAWIAWWHDYVSRPAGAAVAAESGEIDVGLFEARKKKADAEYAEAKVAKINGLTIDRAEADAEKLRLAQRLVGILARQPAELCSRLAGRSAGEVKRIMTEWCDRERREWASDVRRAGKRNRAKDAAANPGVGD